MKILPLLLVSCLATGSVAGQDRAFAAVGVPLDEALEAVIDQTDINLIYGSALVRGRTSFCRIERAGEEALLACVISGTGLDYVRLSSGTYVLVEAARSEALRGGLVGRVVDAETGAPIGEANVVVPGTPNGAATTRDGRFAMAGMLPGPHRIRVSHIGYVPSIDSVSIVAGRRDVVVRLKPRVIASTPIVVEGETTTPAGAENVRRASVHPVVGLGGDDVVRQIESVGGVGIGEALSDVHIQGGASDEHRFRLDGAPVFVPVASGGFIGPFSPLAVDEVTVRKAGFGVPFGSQLSGVIDLELNVAGSSDRNVTVQVDPLSANGRWQGAADLTSETRATWMVAARRSLWDTYHLPQLERMFERWSRPDDVLAAALGSPIPEGPDPKLEVGYTDLHAAARLQLGPLRSLSASAYRGANTFGVDRAPGGEFEDAYRWRNRSVTLRYDWVASSHLIGGVEGWTSDYTLRHPFGLASVGDSTRDERTREFNELRETGARLRGDAAVGAGIGVSAALEIVRTSSRAAISLDPMGGEPLDAVGARPSRWRAASYVEGTVRLSRILAGEAGVRATVVPATGTLYAEPRAALRAEGERWWTRAAVGFYRQFVQSVDVATFSVASLLPTVRFWTPVSPDERPPMAIHYSLAGTVRPHPHWEVHAEAYVKQQPHLLALNHGDPSSGEVFSDARGHAYGVSVEAARRVDGLEVLIRYDGSRVRRVIDNRFEGRSLPVPWEVPHLMTAALDVYPWQRVAVSLRAYLEKGRTWGFRQGYYDYLAPAVLGPFDASHPDHHRLPPLYRIDAAASYTRRIGDARVRVRLVLSNITDRRNVLDWRLRYEAASGTYVRDPRYGRPFVPSISVRAEL